MLTKDHMVCENKSDFTKEVTIMTMCTGRPQAQEILNGEDAEKQVFLLTKN